MTLPTTALMPLGNKKIRVHVLEQLTKDIFLVLDGNERRTCHRNRLTFVKG